MDLWWELLYTRHKLISRTTLLRCAMLAGITRQNILNLCRANGITAHEKDFSLYDVYGADEVFTTGDETYSSYTLYGIRQALSS